MKDRINGERKSSGYVDMFFGLSWLLIVCWKFGTDSPDYIGWEIPMLVMGFAMGIHAFQGWYRVHDWKRGVWYWRFALLEIALLLVSMGLGLQIILG